MIICKFTYPPILVDASLIPLFSSSVHQERNQGLRMSYIVDHLICQGSVNEFRTSRKTQVDQRLRPKHRQHGQRLGAPLPITLTGWLSGPGC